MRARGTRLTPLRFVTETSVNNESSFRLYKDAVEEAQQMDHQGRGVLPHYPTASRGFSPGNPTGKEGPTWSSA